MPRRRKSRIRTSTESSVEIQVTEEQRIVTTTTCTASISPSGSVQASARCDLHVIPQMGFLDLLRSVGARGERTQYGEVFELQNLSNYLKEYVKLRELWDASDPMTIRCKDDPLSKVLGVTQFSLKEVRDLLMKTSQPFDKGATAGDCDTVVTLTDSGYPWESRHHRYGVPVQPSGFSAGHGKHRRKRRRKNTSSSGSSEAKRGRSSIILYSDAEGSSTSYPYLVLHMEESDSEDVLSVQSKTTAVVSDSSDDFWFLEEDVTVEVVEMDSTNEDPPFEEEYEVESDGSLGADDFELTEDSTDQESDSQTHPDVDVEFWADSESSDWETDSTDVELSDSEKWDCKNCNQRNMPTHGHCAGCWKVRDGWLRESEDPRTPEVKTREASQQLKSDTRTGVEGCYTSSDNEAANCYFQSKQNDASSSKWGKSELNLAKDALEKAETVDITKTEVCDNLTLHKEAYPRAGISGVNHTWTPTADIPIMTVTAQETEPEVGLSQITSSQDSGLHDCSPQQSLDSSFDNLDNSQGACVKSLPSSMDRRETANVCDTVSCKNRPICSSPAPPLLQRKDSGIGSFTFLGTSPKEETKQVGEGHSNAVCQSSKESHKDILSKRPHKLQTAHAEPGTSKSSDALCSICLNGPKDASLIHGRTGHQICCYHCAKRLYRRGQPCPVCRRRIHKVIRNYFV